MSAKRRLVTLTFAGLAWACGHPPGGGLDAGSQPIDAGLDAGSQPIDGGRDAGVDAGMLDAGALDAGPIDAGPSPDAGDPLDAGHGGPVMLDPTCGYQPVDNVVLSCGGAWKTFHHLDPIPPNPSCPQLVGVGMLAFTTVGDAAAALACDTACVYIQLNIAQFLYCNVRGEYTTLVPGGPDQTGPSTACAPLYYFTTVAGGGFYPSRKDFEDAHPCPP